jgi:hypothetical protein
VRITDPVSLTARIFDFTAGGQVASNDLNNIQDAIIDGDAAVETLIDELEAQALECQTASGNQADSPAPDVGGAKTVWVEKTTNGTTVVVIDNSVDWRDRYLIIEGMFTSAAASIAGGASDNAISQNLSDGGEGSSTDMHAMFFSRNGQDGSSSNECYENTISGGNVIRFFARDTDGALCFKRTSAGTDNWFIGEIRGSPAQNHY